MVFSAKPGTDRGELARTVVRTSLRLRSTSIVAHAPINAASTFENVRPCTNGRRRRVVAAGAAGSLKEPGEPARAVVSPDTSAGSPPARQSDRVSPHVHDIVRHSVGHLVSASFGESAHSPV